MESILNYLQILHQSVSNILINQRKIQNQLDFYFVPDVNDKLHEEFHLNVREEKQTQGIGFENEFNEIHYKLDGFKKLCANSREFDSHDIKKM